jgi:hypothetical protein
LFIHLWKKYQIPCVILIPKLQSIYAIDANLKYQLFDGTNLDIEIIYRLKNKYKRKCAFTSVIPNFLVNLPPINIINIPEMSLENILKKFDTVYHGTLMYLNPYAQIFIDDPAVLYQRLSFITPKYDTFEDDDLSFCTYEQFIDNINILRKKFQELYKFATA